MRPGEGHALLLAGHFRVHSMAKPFVRAAAGIMVVYDVAGEASSEGTWGMGPWQVALQNLKVRTRQNPPGTHHTPSPALHFYFPGVTAAAFHRPHADGCQSGTGVSLYALPLPLQQAACLLTACCPPSRPCQRYIPCLMAGRQLSGSVCH